MKNDEQGVILRCSSCGAVQRIYTPDTTLDEVILFSRFLGVGQCPLCGAEHREPEIVGYPADDVRDKMEAFEGLLTPAREARQQSKDFDVSDEDTRLDRSKVK